MATKASSYNYAKKKDGFKDIFLNSIMPQNPFVTNLRSTLSNCVSDNSMEKIRSLLKNNHEIIL